MAEGARIARHAHELDIIAGIEVRVALQDLERGHTVVAQNAAAVGGDFDLAGIDVGMLADLEIEIDR